MPTLYLIRGVPGSGKSTFARELQKLLNRSCEFMHEEVLVIEADMWFMLDNGQYIFDASKLHQAHQWCQNLVDLELSQHKSVIVSNTSTTEKEVKVYKDLADKYNAAFVSLIVENRHGGVNQHGVPEEKIQQMKQRFSIKL